ncbi:hypothetical protein [Enterococcus avium]|jgi:hypothetical protein|uniref:hypothetical protein n=1 Tax=Enterococcus avium TaxID=33945 RepID=UPI003D6A64BA
MKIVYEILYPFGAKKVKVGDDYVTRFPYTEIAPDANRDLMLQFWDSKRTIWRPIEYMANEDKICLLEEFYRKATNDVQALSEKNESVNDQLTDTQLALAEVYEMLVPADAAKEVK